jgi:hypothetical protein
MVNKDFLWYSITRSDEAAAPTGEGGRQGRSADVSMNLMPHDVGRDLDGVASFAA